MDTFKEYFHVDIITLLIIAAGYVALHQKLKDDTAWHTKWIKKHSDECDEYKVATSIMLRNLEVTSAKLTAIAESNSNRINRLEDQQDAGVVIHHKK